MEIVPPGSEATGPLANVGGSRSRRIAAAALLLLLLPVAAFLLGHLHYAGRRVSLAISLRGFPYADEKSCRAYLEEIGRFPGRVFRDDLERAEAFITWIHGHSTVKEGILNHPNPVYTLDTGGVCGQFTSVLVSLLRANGIPARQVLLNWERGGTAHTMVEAKVRGKWVALDPFAFGAMPGAAAPRYHLEADGVPLGALELYRRPDALPPGLAYGREFFAKGRCFRIEAREDYGALDIRPKFAYGRDWPLVDKERPDDAAWLYDPALARGVEAVVVTSVFPYFLRVTFWFGPRPLILHFEWVPLLLLAAGIALWRLKGRMPARARRAGFVSIGILAPLYVAAVVALWAARYTA